jgi:hypothetical protein
MITWVALVVPVVSLIAGSLLTMWAQGRGDRRTFERERQARLDTFVIKRYEFDRDTLIELQQILLGLHQAMLGDRPTRVDLDAMRQLNHVRLLESRVESNAVRSSADIYLGIAEEILMRVWTIT